MKITQLSDELFPAFMHFAQRVWDRPEGYYTWLYKKAPDRVTWVACEDSKCVASITGFIRPYLLGGKVVDCMEPFDWYCLPEKRALGVGVWVEETLRRMGMPIVIIGGSDMARALWLKRGAKLVAESEGFLLPINRDALYRNREAPFTKRMAGVLLNCIGWHMFAPGKYKDSKNGHFVPLSALDDQTLAIEQPPGFQPIHRARHLEWLTHGYPELGTFIPLKFMLDGCTVGWSLAHVCSDGMVRKGSILELRFRKGCEAELKWMVRAVTSVICGFGVASVGMRTTCEEIKQALQANKFLKRKNETKPVLCIMGDFELPAAPIRVGMLRGDDGWLRHTTEMFSQLGT